MSGMLGWVVVLGLGWMGAAEEVTLAGGDGVQAVFRASGGTYAWCGYADEFCELGEHGRDVWDVYRYGKRYLQLCR